MSEFQQAAEKATAQVTRWYDDTIGCGVYPNDSFVRKAIIREFAELESTYDKMVELVKIGSRHLKLWDDIESADRYDKLLADPQVQAAMKERK